MKQEQLNIQFGGFGGQGIVLSGVMLGTTVVTKAGLDAVQTQSYGSEARGGECQAEVIVSKTRVDSPLADFTDILVAMNQDAFNKYLPRLKHEGSLIYDPELVIPPPELPQSSFPVPATMMAIKAGNKLAANMVMLGFLQQATGLFTADDLIEVIKENVRQSFLELNLTAVKMGIASAVDKNAKIAI